MVNCLLRKEIFLKRVVLFWTVEVIYKYAKAKDKKKINFHKSKSRENRTVKVNSTFFEIKNKEIL